MGSYVRNIDADVMAPEVHKMIPAMYVSSVDFFRFTTQEFSMVGSYTKDLKNHKTVKIEGWVLAWDNTVCTCVCSVHVALVNTALFKVFFFADVLVSVIVE